MTIQPLPTVEASLSGRCERTSTLGKKLISTLKFTLKYADQISIGSLADLAAMVPEGMTGDALNYGQAEGQLRIGGSIWGFYLTDSGDYLCVLEEGLLSIEEAAAIAIGIIGRVRSLWGSQIESEVRGCHHDDPELRFTT